MSCPSQDIVDEIRRLVDNGVKEVALLGQDANSYKDGRRDFVKLLEPVNNICELERIRSRPTPIRKLLVGEFV